MNDLARSPLSRSARWGIGVLLACLVALGVYVEIRSAHLKRRMGDFGVYVRGAWAVYNGDKLYEIMDNNEWHYVYPPFLAIMLVPFADPPPGTMPPFVSFPAAVLLWYLFNLGCLACGLHMLAGAIEENSNDPAVVSQRAHCRRWWALRIMPLLFCAIPIGHTLMRGQVNLMILAMLCAMIAAFIRKQDFRAGVWLAVATSIKVIPIYLALYPFLKRSGRAIGGWAAGLTVTLVLVPGLTCGPEGACEAYHQFYTRVLGPAFGLSDDTTCQDELRTGLTDNQSLKTSSFHLFYPDFTARPPFESWAERNYRICGLLLTFVTLAVGFRTKFRSDWSQAAFLGALIYLMCVLCPVCHLHYFTYMVPLVMALLARHWEFRRSVALGPWLWGLFWLMTAANLLPQIPSLSLVLRDIGLPMYVGLIFWLVAIQRMWADQRAAEVVDAPRILQIRAVSTDALVGSRAA